VSYITNNTSTTGGGPFGVTGLKAGNSLILTKVDGERVELDGEQLTFLLDMMGFLRFVVNADPHLKELLTAYKTQKRILE
jgi:hypothetical protein